MSRRRFGLYVVAPVEEFDIVTVLPLLPIPLMLLLCVYFQPDAWYTYVWYTLLIMAFGIIQWLFVRRWPEEGDDDFSDWRGPYAPA